MKHNGYSTFQVPFCMPISNDNLLELNEIFNHIIMSGLLLNRVSTGLGQVAVTILDNNSKFSI